MVTIKIKLVFDRLPNADGYWHSVTVSCWLARRMHFAKFSEACELAAKYVPHGYHIVKFDIPYFSS